MDSLTTYTNNYEYKGPAIISKDRPRSKKDLLKNDDKNYNDISSYKLQYKAQMGDRPQKVVYPG